MKESFPARKKSAVGHAVRAAVLLMSCTLAGTAAHAQTPAPASNMAQEPLISKDPGIVEPNIMFTLDDSGSMAFNYLPDSDLMSDIRASDGAVYPAQHIFAYHPKEPDKREYAIFVEGLLSTSGKNILGARRRSAAVNKLYYNPEVRYKPWIKPDGKRLDESSVDANRMEPANPKAAFFHKGFKGNAAIAALTIDLTKNAPRGNMPICASRRTQLAQTLRDGSRTSPRCHASSETEISPAVYFDYNWTKRGKGPEVPLSEDEKNTLDNYIRVDINDPKNTTFTRGRERTDCTPVDATKQQHTCTQAQELQNFANWYQYHRTRLHVAIAAVGEAFMMLDDNVRVGYGRINNDETPTIIDGVGGEIVQKGVRHFDTATRKSFIDWLYGTKPEGGTPLVNAMYRVGLYFKRGDDGGPWSDDPEARRSGRDGHLSCRRSYHVLMTDGMYNFDSERDGRPGKKRSSFRDNADNEPGTEITGVSKGAAAKYMYRPERPHASSASGTLADYAMRYWKDDLRPDLPNNVPLSSGNPAFWQHLITHTLSFGVSGRLNKDDGDLNEIIKGTKRWPDPVDLSNGDTIDDLWHAAVNSRGEYVNVQEGAGFYKQINTILTSIANARGDTSSGVTMSSQSLQTGNTKFVPSFVTREWTGELTAYGVDEAGNQLPELWTATDKLPEPNKRRLFVGKGETQETVKAAEFAWRVLPADMKTEMAKKAGVAESLGEHLVAWMRGDQMNEGGLFRRRKSIVNTRRAMMGHFVNSTPAYVGAAIDRGYSFLPAELPRGTDSGRDSYKKYVESKKAGARRPGTLFIGGNDGILHAFDEKTGVEVFGFIPRAVVGEMAGASRIDYQNRFLVDGPLVERDAFLNNKWQNVLVGSTGAGPASVFALNVTDTSTGQLQGRNLMWEITQATYPALGHVLSPAEVGVTRDGKWVAIFGNGYESVGRQAQLFIVDLETGMVKVLNTGVGSANNPNGLGGVTLVRDGTQVITAAYAGDLHGNVWKFDLASENQANWGVALNDPLFVTKPRRPITAPPATVSHPAGGVMVLVGTGKLFEKGDELDLNEEAIYGLWDNQRLQPREVSPASGSIPARIDFRWEGGSKINDSAILRNQAVRIENGAYAVIRSVVPDWNVHRGWRLPLTMLKEGGQRLITQPLLVTGMALFETMTPVYENNGAQNACQERLTNPAFSLLLDPLSGQMAEKSVIDTDNNRKINSDDRIVGGWYVNDWSGRSVILTQPPPAPCTAAPCVSAVNHAVCDKGYLMSSAQGTSAQGTSMCVEIPAATRWWWRELAVPDISNGTQLRPDPADQDAAAGN